MGIGLAEGDGGRAGCRRVSCCVGGSVRRRHSVAFPSLVSVKRLPLVARERFCLGSRPHPSVGEFFDRPLLAIRHYRLGFNLMDGEYVPKRRSIATLVDGGACRRRRALCCRWLDSAL